MNFRMNNNKNNYFMVNNLKNEKEKQWKELIKIQLVNK